MAWREITWTSEGEGFRCDLSMASVGEETQSVDTAGGSAGMAPMAHVDGGRGLEGASGRADR